MWNKTWIELELNWIASCTTTTIRKHHTSILLKYLYERVSKYMFKSNDKVIQVSIPIVFKDIGQIESYSNLNNSKIYMSNK